MSELPTCPIDYVRGPNEPYKPWYFRRRSLEKWANNGTSEPMREFYLARCEHAGRLRGEGLTLKQIGRRLGLSVERARQLVVFQEWWG